MDVLHGAGSYIGPVYDLPHMPCDHKGGPELIEMAEEKLRAGAVPPEQWPGLRFRWAENLDDSMWASVIVEIERRGEQWIITRLDRNREKLAADALGFRALQA
jgi:hypothetical protein